MTAALDRAVANALGPKSVNNCEKWGRTMDEAQPAQEPVAIECICKAADMPFGRCCKAQLQMQEPVGKFAKFTDGVWREVTNGSAGIPLYTATLQPEQKPMDDVRGFLAARLTCWHRLTQKESNELVALFEVKPPQRTWVGLTDEEKDHLIGLHIRVAQGAVDAWIEGLDDFIQAIQAKLKEKNT